jgi:hypothetical protein
VSTPQPSAAVEASLFARMDSQDTATSNYVNSFPLGSSSSVQAEWINGLSGEIAAYLQFQQECQWLQQQGLPQAQQRLDAKVADLNNAFNIYMETYSDTLNAERERGLIVQEAIQFGTVQALMANAYQVAAANGWVTGLEDINENRCLYCHQRPQLPGYPYCLECARELGLVSWS